MRYLVPPTEAPAPRLASSVAMSRLLAALFVVMAVAQLFTLDAFIELFYSMNLSIGERGASLLAPLVVVLEVFSLPFLLRMTVSTAFRWVSMGASWLAVVVWFYVTTSMAFSTGVPVHTVGLLGDIADLSPGWWAVAFSAALGTLTLWSSVGMWPAVKRHASR